MYQVHEASQAVLFVEELEDGSEGEADGEEHGGVTAAGRVRALQQPQRVAYHLRQQRMRQHADLNTAHASQHNTRKHDGKHSLNRSQRYTDTLSMASWL